MDAFRGDRWAQFGTSYLAIPAKFSASYLKLTVEGIPSCITH